MPRIGLLPSEGIVEILDKDLKADGDPRRRELDQKLRQRLQFVDGVQHYGAILDHDKLQAVEVRFALASNVFAGLGRPGYVGFEGGLSLIAYVNNLFDENALLGFDRERGGRARLGYTVGQPRTFGITARKIGNDEIRSRVGDDPCAWLPSLLQQVQDRRIRNSRSVE